MYALTASGPQMLFFSAAHTMPFLVLAVWLAFPAGAAWIIQSAAALLLATYRAKVQVPRSSALVFVVALALQAILLATYDKWSGSSLRVSICCIGLASVALLLRAWFRCLKSSVPKASGRATSEA
jgi:hypothetical protein